MSLLAFALATSFDASAAVHAGNPTVKIWVDRTAHDLTEADVVLDKIRVGYCGGGYTDYAVDEAVDLVVTPYEHVISGGDLCSVRAYWSSSMLIDSATFSLEYDAAYTTVDVSGTIHPVGLTPFEVLSGSITGNPPALFVSID